MTVKWLSEAAVSLASVCMIIAIVECISEADGKNGLRLVCGAAAASGIIHLAVVWIREIL